MTTEYSPPQFDGYMRLEQIIGTQKAVGSTAKRPLKRERKVIYPPLIPISRGTWLAGVKEGRFPAPIRLSARVVVWKARDVLELLKKEG